MKIIYDISPVGNRPEARTGVARAAWTTAVLLREKLGNELSLAACGSIWSALQAEDLLHCHPEIPSAVQPVSPIARQVHYYQEKLRDWRGKGACSFGPVLEVGEQLLTNVSRFLNLTRKPIKSTYLKQADLFHSPYARIPAQVRQSLPGQHVLTINDLIPLVLDPALFPPGNIAITRRIIDSVQPEDWIITISDATRNDLCNYRPVDPARVITVHLAASKELFYRIEQAEVIQAIRQKYGIPPGPYLLTLHSLAPHKNLAHLIRCFQKVIQQEKIQDLTLVVCGGQGRPVDDILPTLGLNRTDLHQVHFTGFVADEDLAALYSGAKAFVFPSLYEGFGLPVLEAMQCGCPVIASNSSSLPEIVGEAGLLTPPDDEDALCQAILKLHKSDFLQRELARQGQERAKTFSWNKTITETITIYEMVKCSGK